MSGLWEDIDGERWLDNPQLILAGNPKRRKKTMARTTRRRRGRKNSPRRRRRARRNYAASGLIANPRRRRRTYRRRRRVSLNPLRRRRRARRNPRRRRHYRRNPGVMSLAGFSLPPIDAILFTGAGIVIPPVMTSFLMGYLPVDWRTSKAAYYGVKIASVLIPSMLVKKFVSRRAGNFMLVGGAASFAIDLVREFAPGLLPGGVSGQPFLGFYERMPSRIPMTATPGMGRYSSIPVRSVPVQRTPMVSQTPDRLSPDSRF